jgi:hypothetical protein
VDAVTAPAPAAHSGKPPRLAAVEPSPEAAFDPEGPSFPQKNTADQNELPPELETPDPAQNESAGP